MEVSKRLDSIGRRLSTLEKKVNQLQVIETEMENLNKENFWNELQEKYPVGMKIFCDWIDEYKKQNAWSILFNIGGKVNYNSGQHNVKYHHLPIAMQIGIFIEFVTNVYWGTFDVGDLNKVDWKRDITELIGTLHRANEIVPDGDIQEDVNDCTKCGAKGTSIVLISLHGMVEKPCTKCGQISVFDRYREWLKSNRL